ncbi:hypothetical protein ABFS82_13G085000 [Erythranthe guttata]|uniref:FAM86 N-terminal domain-containing protein n=1 Tax=Erythranthe guttata TaxID=4155 RepID=A0A022R3E2_ERYGU|nr:PREDICTED: putative uncharacterized protein DDB_G0277003 [Erythranthe guttata]EYU33350.1 hypothetical protein MIMGU_mgv1a008916mg [Erythranthe guttata]|eukprot:XP_012842198.1 PREDICTED: putative uncharacterized protein DDB_G0277003 [Erythranthe guttata]
MAAEEELGISAPSYLHMVSAFLALEPPDVVISFARDFGGGYITESVQKCIWHHCIAKSDVKWKGAYLKRFLKKFIMEIESSGGVVLDELYEQYASYMISLQDDDASKANSRVLKTISFLFPNESYGTVSCPKSGKLEVQLQCSVNMLEGDTGCSIWPSSLFLSEFILSFPELFANKRCFEVGSGVGLVGICLSYVKASNVILSDGDLSTLANMKVNLELNHLSTGNIKSDSLENHDMVHCVCLPWESASEDNLCSFAPDVILGADIIYNPSCLPHLVRVLTGLLTHEHPNASGPVAYIASVVRNIDTLNYFLALAEKAKLIVTDLTESTEVSNFLPYLRSYNQCSIRLFRICLASKVA